MGSTVLRIAYRPLRIGFVIRQGHAEDILAAVKLNTVLWGGMHNFLVPLGGPDQSGARELVKWARVDLLHPVADTEEVRDFCNSMKHLRWDTVHHEGLYQRGPDGERLSVVDILAWLDRHRQRYGGDETTSRFVVVQWNEADPLALVFAIMFGKFPAPTERGIFFDYEQAYRSALGARTELAVPGAGFPLQDFLVHRYPALLLTALELQPNQLAPERAAGLYVGQAGSLDLVNFWNLRAAGANLTYCPIEHIDRISGYTTRWLQDLARRQRGAPRFRLYHRRETEPPREVLALFPAESPPTSPQIVAAPETFIDSPIFSLDDQNVLASVEIRQEGPPSIDLSLPGPPFDVRELDWAGQQQAWVASIRSSTEYAFPGYTLNLPGLPDLNEWYSRRVTVVPWTLRVEPEAVGLITYVSSQTLHLQPVKIPDLVNQIATRAGITAALSQPGRKAQQLIQQMGELEGCRVFKIAGVRVLIASGEAHDGVTRSHAVQVIGNADPETGQPRFEKYESLHIERRDEPKLTPHSTFDFLLKRRILRAGLILECPRCLLKFWLGIQSFGEESRCEFCGEAFEVTPQLKDRGDWRFRVTGLFGSKGGEEGAIPVVLTLLQLLRMQGPSGSFLYTCPTKLVGDGVDCETDFIVIEHNGRPFPNIVLGEAKTGYEITEEDVRKLSTASTKLEQSGVQSYLLFSTTRDTFTEAEIARFRTLTSHRVILFTSRELEPYFVYEDAPDGLPIKYAHGLGDLVRNSQWLYLRA